MTQAIIKLKQVGPYNRSSKIRAEELVNADEGDELGQFKVVSVEEQKCEHSERIWSLNSKKSSEPPKMVGRCQVCGDELEVDPYK